MTLQKGAVNRHVVNPLLSLMFDGIENILRGHIENIVKLFANLVHRNCTDRNRNVVDHTLAQTVDFIAGREVHYGVGTVFDRAKDLFQFLLDASDDGGISKVSVNLGRNGDSNTDRRKAFFKMNPVCRNDQTTSSYLVSDKFRGKMFFLGDNFHFGGNFPQKSFLILGHFCFFRNTLPRRAASR